MRHVVCRFFLLSAAALFALEVAQTGFHFDRLGKAALVVFSIFIMVMASHLKLRVGRLLRPLLIALAIVLLFAFIVAIIQIPELRSLVEQIAQNLAAVLADILSLRSPLPLVLAVLSLIVYGVLSSRRPASSA